VKEQSPAGGEFEGKDEHPEWRLDLEGVSDREREGGGLAPDEKKKLKKKKKVLRGKNRIVSGGTKGNSKSRVFPPAEEKARENWGPGEKDKL